MYFNRKFVLWEFPFYFAIANHLFDYRLLFSIQNCSLNNARREIVQLKMYLFLCFPSFALLLSIHNSSISSDHKRKKNFTDKSCSSLYLLRLLNWQFCSTINNIWGIEKINPTLTDNRKFDKVGSDIRADKSLKVALRSINGIKYCQYHGF